MTATTRRGAVLFAALALGASGCAKDSDEAAGEVQAVVKASTALVEEGPFRETITAIGSVVSRTGSVALLSAPAPTRVTKVLVVAGQSVAKGAVLVELDLAPFQARAQSADGALQAAERSRERAQRLVDQGIAARRELEQADADLARARAEAADASRDARLARLESPIAGVVTKMNAVLGASVDANEPLVEVADPNAVDVLIMVSPSDAARVRVGVRVQLANDQGATPEQLGVSTVTEIGGAVDADTRAVAIRARGGSLKRALRIGESVAATITIAEHAKALTVPLEALVPEGEGFTVFVVDAEGVAHQQEVKVGGRTATGAQIMEGLKAGDRVVTYGAFGVSDGAKIDAMAKTP